MPTYRKRGNGRIQVMIRLKNASPESRTFDDIQDATSWAMARELELGRKPAHGRQLASRLGPTLREALERYASEVTPRKKSFRTELGVISRWLKNPLVDLPIYGIRGADLTVYMNQRLARGIAIATIRTEIALISHLYEVARTDWGYEDVLNPRKAMRRIQQGNVRDRRLRPGEFDKIVGWCERVGDYWLNAAVIVAIETAMRSGEIASLTWPNLDLDGQLAYLPDTKNGAPRVVPLSRAAVAAIRTLPVRPGRPVFDIRKGSIARRFKKVRIACDLEDLKFHDLQHEGISRLFEKGFNMMEVAAISGHKTLQMLKRYTHLDPRNLLGRLG
ncbi:integrase [Burkholderia cenocepacia]|uniref:integrase n=1 Tax=Burkholderia cenocepacia TaxID=95486 RepID=UPI002231E016|nr:site-specific integrase [Burkholderia cenocepacia]MCW3609972.1 site-specific integrase [Burkholderia cenocepacia]MCW5190810.1 site-specific integrase [Burkholderia cenocepacia]